MDKYESEKFYCLLPKRRTEQLKKYSLENVGEIPMLNYINSKANIVLLEDIVNHKWARELSLEPFGDFEGTVFSALQFILYLHPRKIYIVGCDCTKNGHFYDCDNKKPLINIPSLRHWMEFKEFAQYEYPDVEIISINPVGLKGLFKDEFSEDFLKTDMAV